MGRNLVLLMDGTGNEPSLDRDTNVLRLYDRIVGQPDQLVWYDAGVGTVGSSKALTPIGRWTSKIAGLAFGYGLKDNLVEAYRFVMDNWEPDDQIYVLGFSRGAYSARALCGFLYQMGLLRQEHSNMIPYALKHFWWNASTDVTSKKWSDAEKFSKQFARKGFGRRRLRSVHFLGIWDTVNATGYLRPPLVLPWTSALPMARKAFHAVSIDERRRPYEPTLIDLEAVKERPADLNEVWFAGVHSDVGGTFKDDHRLADITFRWMLDAATANGLRWDGKIDDDLGLHTSDATDSVIHDMGWKWKITTLFHHREIRPATARIHESVIVRKDARDDYRPSLPDGHQTEPWANVP